MRYVTVVFIMSCFASESALAQAWVCNPRDFTFEEVQQIDFSDLAKLAAYSTAEKSTTDQKDSETVVGGQYGPIKGNFSKKDARALSEHILQSSGYKASRDTRLHIATSALSRTGADMYKDCLGTRIITVTLSPAAYTDKQFFMGIKWDPKPPQPGNIVLQLQNARADHFDRRINTGEELPGIRITKLDENKPVEIALNISKASYPVIYIPPKIQIRKFTTVKRYYPPGKDPARLVSECGSGAGCDSKGPVPLCITASPEGILLPSTADFEIEKLQGTGRAWKDPKNSPQKSCGYMQTIGTGWKEGKPDGRNEAIGKFFVLKTVPDTKPN
jgi:hypothetical protein